MQDNPYLCNSDFSFFRAFAHADESRVEVKTSIMKLRSSITTEGRRMAGARALWIANGMKKEQMGKPVIAIANSFTQFVPGHTLLHEAG